MRCQRKTVSGLTMVMARRTRGQRRYRGSFLMRSAKRWAPRSPCWQTPAPSSYALDRCQHAAGAARRPHLVAAIADAIEARHTGIITSHRFPGDDAAARAQPGQRFDDQREAIGQVIAGAAVKAHALAVLACDDPEAVPFGRLCASPVSATVFVGKSGDNCGAPGASSKKTRRVAFLSQERSAARHSRAPSTVGNALPHSSRFAMSNARVRQSSPSS
jgi:hypothetical protein